MPAYDTNSDVDIELNQGFQVSVSGLLAAIENDPALSALIERIARQTNLKTARRVGNTSGKWAQRQLPQAVVNQNPATKRVF